MSKSVELKKIEEWADNFELAAYDKRFNLSSLIIHEEGTVCFYQNSFIVEHGDWIIVFPEHHNYHIFHKSDLYNYVQYKRTSVGDK